MQRDGRGNEGTNLQAAHLPRKAPKDTLPMPVANTQKQKKCSRNSECSAKTRNREGHREKDKSNKSTELRAELLSRHLGAR